MDLILIYIIKKYTNSSNFLKLYMPGTEIQAYLVTKVDKTINKQVFVAWNNLLGYDTENSVSLQRLWNLRGG